MGRIRKLKREEIEGPTAEQFDAAKFELQDIVDRQGGAPIRIGKAYRRKPMIDTLLEQKVISYVEHKALKHYRHHADLIDHSPLKDSIRKLLRVQGGGTGGTAERHLYASRIVNDCERAAGQLVDILRAVVVYDISLSQWAMTRHGSTDRCRMQKGVRVCRPEPSNSAVNNARLEFQMAAKRVHSELVA